jgi:hypothetical protein
LTDRGEPPIRVAGWLAAVFLLGLLWPASWASAQDPIARGMKEVGLGGAISISHGTEDDFNTVTGFQLLPHVGYVATDAMGSGWVRGNLELLLEPSLLHLDTEVGSSTVVGLSMLGRWILGGSRVRPYLDVGVGMLVGETNLPQTDCDVNFLLQGGPGLLFVVSNTTTLAVGYRFQHISNAGTCAINPGINSSALYLSVNYLFR